MRVLHYLSAVCLLVVMVAAAAEEAETAAETTTTTEEEATPAEPVVKEKTKPAFDAADHTDWGTYYDPQGEFCGDYDCYKILGFDYENYQSPDRKEITQRYRALSRAWHPDKSKHKDAKERFVKIARAYEVLTDEETRKEYDFMRYNQEAYFQKYGSSVIWGYAAQSDTTLVVIFLLTAGSIISWYVQKGQWSNVADKLIRAAVEDWGSGQGGTPESKDLRIRALKILEERKKEEPATNGDDAAAASKKKKKGVKLTATEKRKQQEDSLRPIVAEMVEEIEDFGAGYHKPTWRDLLVVKVANFPVTFSKAVAWNAKYGVRRLQGLELNEEEREVLTRRAVGEIAWVSSDEIEQKKMILKDLWIADNMVEWEEEQEMKQWSNGDRKRYMRMKKKGMPKDMSFLKDE